MGASSLGVATPLMVASVRLVLMGDAVAVMPLSRCLRWSSVQFGRPLAWQRETSRHSSWMTQVECRLWWVRIQTATGAARRASLPALWPRYQGWCILETVVGEWSPGLFTWPFVQIYGARQWIRCRRRYAQSGWAAECFFLGISRRRGASASIWRQL